MLRRLLLVSLSILAVALAVVVLRSDSPAQSPMQGLIHLAAIPWGGNSVWVAVREDGQWWSMQAEGGGGWIYRGWVGPGRFVCVAGGATNNGYPTFLAITEAGDLWRNFDGSDTWEAQGQLGGTTAVPDLTPSTWGTIKANGAK